jgi:hypothetical protein
MNPTAIYSKSGKGVQESSGKTSLLKRPDRAVLSAIDGRATLADVAQKVGKSFDPEFQQLIRQLDKDGFIREVSAGAAARPAAASKRPAAAPKPAAKASDAKTDLDFSSLFPPSKPAASTQPPAGPAPATPSVPPKEQESALFKARQAAEAKAQAERERARLEAEAKVRAATEERLRLEAEGKIKAAREEAERLRKEAERQAREEAERLRREAEDHARQVREEAERQAREEAERLRRQFEEERRQLEEERRRREEEDRREQEERAARRRREQEEEERERAQREARRKKELEEEASRAKPQPVPDLDFSSQAEPQPAAPAPPTGGFADNLLADLDAFTTREEDERKAEAEAQAKAKAQAQAEREREEAARREKEEAERRRQERAAQRQREEEQSRASEETAQARMREEEERRRQEAEQRKRKAKEEDARAARAAKRGSEVAAADAELMAARQRAARQMASAKPRRRRSWSKSIAGVLAVLLAVALAVAHVMPIHVQDYERAATEALGRPVRIGSGRFWLFTGLQLRFENVSAGEDIRAARVIAHPSIFSLHQDRKTFSLVEVEGLTLPQEALGDALFARLRSDRFRVSRIEVRRLQLPGALPLPSGLEAELSLGTGGSVRAATVRGPEGLVARLSPRDAALEFDLSAASFTLPVAPEVSLSQFAMKGTATREGMRITEWDGALLNGTLSGTAAVRWGRSWSVEGVITARGINAAVFAPALLSDGRAEGTGRFSMSGAEPAKLGSSGRIEGSFAVGRGVLGSFDLSRAIQTGGRQAQGRTQFAEMSGHATYEHGAVALRNVSIGAGALNAGASADIAASGALSGRIVADVRTATQTLRATLVLGGTVKEPQVRN